MKQSFFFIMLLAAASTSASQRSRHAMQAIAENHFSQTVCVKAAGSNTGKAIKVDCVYEESGYAVFAPSTDDAFVILSKSDLTSPVLGYSQSRFDPKDMPNDMRWYLSVVSRNIQEAELRNVELKSSRKAATTPVEPFITTLWHQGDPYNLLTPKNYPAGCVAVAMAQCINYCQYPGNVDFRGYAYCSESPGSKRYVVDSLDIQGIYFFPFLNIYGRATDRQKNSVAKLIRDCGYASYMQYDKNGSGTYNYLGGMAMTSCFKYPEECVKYAEQSYFNGTNDDWNNIIYREMALKSPVIYGASDSIQGGHAFVLCGLDADGLVYVNWGWGGDGDGFFDIALMNPKGYNFIEGHDMIYGIRNQPVEGDRAEPRIYSYDGEPYTLSLKEEKDDDGVMHKAIHITSTKGIINLTPCTMDGEFGIFGLDVTTGQPWQIIETDPTVLQPGSGYFLREPAEIFYYYVENQMIPGHTYRISFGTRDKREQVWHSVQAVGGEVAYDIYYTGDPATTTFSERTEAYIVDGVKDIAASSASETDGITRVYDITGRLVYTAPTSRFNLQNVPAHGTLIVKRGKEVRKVIR